MTGNIVSPWDASTLSYYAGQVADHSFTVKIWDGSKATGNRVAVPAFNVKVTLSSTQVPYGVAEFSTPKLQLVEGVSSIIPSPGVTWPYNLSSGLSAQTAPIQLTPVEILAGYKHTISGVMTDDQQRIFFGFVTATKETADHIEWKAVTAEQLWEFPSHRTYGGPSSTYTTVKQVTDAFTALSDPWYINPALISGTLNTPTSTQLTSFRAVDLGIGDNLGDYLRTLAQTLGQRMRPDWRNNVLQMRVDAEPTYSTANALTIADAVDYSIDASAEDGYATVVNIKCVWYSSGDQKTTQRTFANAGLGGLTPNYGITLAVPGDGTIYQKPPGGTIPTDSAWGPTALWIRRRLKNCLKYTATARAAYWIQPFDVVTFTNPGFSVAVDSVTFNLDSGTMTVSGAKA